MQKLAFIIALAIAGVTADVSHLSNPGKEGYDYPKPVIPFETGNENTYVPPDPPAPPPPAEYLPPVT